MIHRLIITKLSWAKIKKRTSYVILLYFFRSVIYFQPSELIALTLIDTLGIHFTIVIIQEI